MVNKDLRASSFTHYTIPLETGSRIFSLRTLNANSTFRRPRRPFMAVKIRFLSFRREVLTIAVKIADEMEERVLIRVRETELWISCTVDTDENYLSRYAYFALEELLWFREQYNFEKFYWPGFFDKNTGKSKYLNVINDRKGFDVLINPKYPTFYKPGHSLPEFKSIAVREVVQRDVNLIERINSNPEYTIGYILADTNLKSHHSPHLPFLVPFHGVPTKDLSNVKSFSAFIQENQNPHFLEYSPTQQGLNRLCFQMKEVALPEGSENSDTVNAGESGEGLFQLWEEAICMLTAQQQHKYYYFTFGMKNIKGKPRKKWLRQCRFSIEIPKLVIQVVDKGDFLEIGLKFKIKSRTFIPHALNTAFFLSSRSDPLTFYLLGSFHDYQVVNYFSKSGFKFAVLKVHFTDRLQQFLKQCE